MLGSKAARPKHSPKGRVITFYSYKGGTGRSMAVANIAWMLAFCGERVLIIDWDLEAPGIHRYFHPFLHDKELSDTEGLLDFVDKLAGRAAVASEPLSEDEVDIIEYIKVLNWPASSSLRWDMFGPFAGIDLLVAGKQWPAYGQKLNTFNWIDFYEKLGGRRLLEIARDQMRGVYDYILIDSRTGVSDTSGICTVEMPDSVVVCFTLNDQSIKGASGVADSVLQQWKARFASAPRAQSAAAVAASSEGTQAPVSLGSSVLQSQAAVSGSSSASSGRSPLRIFPVPTRVEIVSERAKREVALAFAQQKFSSFLDHLPRDLRSRYWLRVQLPYFPFYAFEEIPAVFGDPASDELSLSTPLKHIARYITDNQSLELLPLHEDFEEAEKIRKEILSWYVRKVDVGPQDAVQLCQSTYDQLDRDEQLLMRKVMLRLVQVVAGSPPSLATVPVDDFEPPLDGTVQLLAKAGLVQYSGSSVFLADRKVVESWDLLRQWLKEDSTFLLWRQKLVVSVRSWTDHSSDRSALLRGALLTEALQWIRERPDDLTRPERDYIAAGKKARDQHRISQIGGFVAAVAIGLASVSSWYFQRKPPTPPPEAVITLAQQYVDKDPLTSALLLMEIKDYKASGSDLSFALKVVQSSYPEQIFRSVSSVETLEFSRDGKMLVTTGGKQAELWDAATWKKIRDVGDGSKKFLSASFNGWDPDAAKQHGGYGQISRIVTTDEAGVVQVWDLQGSQVLTYNAANPQLATCLVPGAEKKVSPQEASRLGNPMYARFSPDDAVLIAAYKTGVLVMSKADSGRCLDVYNPLSGSLAHFSPDGEWVASTRAKPAMLNMFHVQDWKQESYDFTRFLTTAKPGPWDVSYVLDNETAVIQAGNLSYLWNARSLERAPNLGFLGQPILSWNRKYVAGVTLSSAAGALLQPVSDREQRTFLAGHSDAITALSFAPASNYLLTASRDHTVRVWPLQKNAPNALASWQQIIDYLRQSTKVCFTADERAKLLGEKPAEANKKSQQCRAAQK